MKDLEFHERGDSFKHNEEDNIKPTVQPDFSIFTAASESEFCNNLRSYADRFHSSYERNGMPISAELAQQQASLKYWLSRIRLCTLISTILIGCFLLVDINSGNIASTICSFLFIVAIAFFSEWGCQQKDWRPLVALFVFCFIIVAYSAARFLVDALQFISQLALLSVSQLEDSNQRQKLTPPLTILFPINLFLLIFELGCVLFWGHTVYVIEKTIRIILDTPNQRIHRRRLGSEEPFRFTRHVASSTPVSHQACQQQQQQQPQINRSYSGTTPRQDFTAMSQDKYASASLPKFSKDDTQCSNDYDSYNAIECHSEKPETKQPTTFSARKKNPKDIFKRIAQL